VIPLRLLATGLCVLALLAVVSAIGSAGWWLRNLQCTAVVARLQEAHAQEREQAATAAAELQATYRETEALRQRARERTLHDIQTDTARDAAHAAAVRPELGRLRSSAAAAAAAACSPAPGGAAVAAAGPPAATTGDLLADVLAGLAEAGAEIAAEADRRRTAGLGCEREHDAVSGGSTP